MVWYGILAAVFVLEIVIIVLLRKTSRASEESARGKWIFFAVEIIVLIGLAVWSLYNAVIILLHWCVFLCVGMLADGILSLVRKNREGGKGTNPVWIAATVACIVWLGIGWYAAHHVCRTDYSLMTGKTLGQNRLRIAQISDTHIGVTMDADGFAERLASVAEAQPDIVVVTGDFTDEDTLREDMMACCKALGELKTKYGVYFVFGNHDCSDDGRREFTVSEVETALRENGVIVLRDEVVQVTDHVCIIGRRDTSESRKSVSELMKDVDLSQYVIVLDHQPDSFSKEAEAGADLVLSGHTHGGQLIPLGLMSSMLPMLFGESGQVYGKWTYDKTTCIVSSGMSSWKFWFKTGTISEFVIVDVAVK